MYGHTVIFTPPGETHGFAESEARILTERGVVITDNLDKARDHLFGEQGRFISVQVVGSEPSRETVELLRGCARHLSVLPDFQILVCADPGLRLQALAHDSGVRRFWRPQSLAPRLLSWLNFELENHRAQDPAHFRLGVLVANRKWPEVTPSLPILEEGAQSDFRMAYILGHYLLGVRAPAKAEEAFALAWKLNPLFPPALSFLAKAKLEAGKAKEALALLNRLETLDGANPERKVLMAAAAADSGDWIAAEDRVRAASQLMADHPLVLQMKALILLNDGDIDFACSLIRRCGQIDAHFVTRFNEAGIRLSHEGKHAAAESLYETVWRVAPDDLKYKLSYNAAITSKRSEAIDKAIVHAERAIAECPPAMAPKIQIFLDGLLRIRPKKCV